MEIKVLGSVSPYPKATKNGCGYLISYEQDKLLLDCGSGISRLLDMTKDLNNLSIIISHYHKDHYVDLCSIAYSSYVLHNLGYLNKRINVYIPIPDLIIEKQDYIDDDGWCHKGNFETKIIDYEYIKSLKEHYMNFIEYDENTKLTIGNMNISFYKTLHELNTYASKIECNNQILTYSADTGYDENITDFIKNSHLFICESTFLKGQLRRENYHLYASEAGHIAKISNVEKLMLTHFWPEIDKNVYVKEAKYEFNNVIAAEENMKLTLKY